MFHSYHPCAKPGKSSVHDVDHPPQALSVAIARSRDFSTRKGRHMPAFASRSKTARKQRGLAVHPGIARAIPKETVSARNNITLATAKPGLGRAHLRPERRAGQTPMTKRRGCWRLVNNMATGRCWSQSAEAGSDTAMAHTMARTNCCSEKGFRSMNRGSAVWPGWTSDPVT
jgi:hypothetical protein